jgi:glycosyltransferase involved in cell wall biosynthesis
VPPIKVLTVLTYYHPHWTGLTAIAKRIAEGLAGRGHEVTVLAMQHAPELARHEVVNGVSVVRLPPVGRLSRGLLAPSFPRAANKLIRSHDVVHIHTPILEGLLVAALCRLHRRPLLMTHQGDLVMPSGLVNQAVERFGTAMLSATGRLATVVSPLNPDYATHSSFLRPFTQKIVPILPPVEIPVPEDGAGSRWRTELGLDGTRVIGFAGRFVEEKGFDYLLRAIPSLLETDPNARLVYAGDHEILYEDFFDRCKPLLDAHREYISFVGLLRDRQQLANFYALCDVFVLPSRTDSFAAVQVEAMLSGTPVVATDIPGAREPVRQTGMGTLVRPRSPGALAAGISEVLREPSRFVRRRTEIEAVFDPAQSIDEYEALMASLVARRE